MKNITNGLYKEAKENKYVNIFHTNFYPFA